MLMKVAGGYGGAYGPESGPPSGYGVNQVL